MASVPNTRPAPLPAPTGTAPAAVTPAGFARKLAGIPEELLQIPAAILAGGEDAPTSDEAAKEGGTDAETVPAADAPSDAAQLAALAPLLQSLPALVPVTALAPTPTPAPAPKVETAAVATPTPAALPIAPAPLPTGKIAKVKPDAQNGTTHADIDPDTDAGKREAAPALDAAAKDVVAAAKRTIEAALRAPQPALADAAPKTARLVASALETVREALPQQLAADIKGSIDDLATSTAALTAPTAQAPAPSAAAQPRETAAAAPDRTLDIANDAEWLDRLARDIAQASGNEGTIRFRLHPQTLGNLHVELSQGEHGTSIRLTADTEHARSILADAQPRLVAEARAQGVRIAETHVDLSGSDRQASGDPRRQDDTRQTPLIRTARDAAAGEDAPERPGRSQSDRYA